MKDYTKKHENLFMAWIDYKKAYDFVPYSGINECMELLGIADNVRNFLERSMEQWKLWLMSNGKGWCEERDISRRQPFTTVCFVCMYVCMYLFAIINNCYNLQYYLMKYHNWKNKILLKPNRKISRPQIAGINPIKIC